MGSGTEPTIIFFADLVRFMLVTMASVLIGVTTRVILQYYRASRYAMKQGDFRGILPMHVWLISISYITLILGSVIHHVISLNTYPDAYLALNSIAYTTGAVALWLILRFESRRVVEGRMEERRVSEERRLADLTTMEFRIQRQEQRRRDDDISGTDPDLD